MLIGDEVVTFLAVVQSGSLQQAAEIVHATQSTVSYRIQALEQRIGHALLLRSRGSRTLSLTAEGERFLDIAERWRTLEREAQQLGSKSDRSLSIGAADALALHVLQPFFKAGDARAASTIEYRDSEVLGAQQACQFRLSPRGILLCRAVPRGSCRAADHERASRRCEKHRSTSCS
ncbi:LysR family transcriptional regulator [Burkholderia anthina]|uniref:LysR family transcriptional regulator n=1 Tax=Burkholderia anthina TaxID=179879 RepID=UPI001AA07B20|nr:LysR family transcriptional regulator [Burkholderia anthina]